MEASCEDELIQDELLQDGTEDFVYATSNLEGVVHHATSNIEGVVHQHMRYRTQKSLVMHACGTGSVLEHVEAYSVKNALVAA